MTDGGSVTPTATALGLVTRRWSVGEWSRGQRPWDDLLANSHADPLFLSWGWLMHWWQCYGQVLGRSPTIAAFYRGGTLVGLAPLYHRVVRRGGVVLARSVQIIGLSWRDPEPLISEYLDVIATPGEVVAVRDACVAMLLEQRGWQEFVVGQTTEGRNWREAIEARSPRGAHRVRELDPSISYQADLTDGFGAYLKHLGQSTRRSVWNLRRRLGAYGSIALERAGSGEIVQSFAELNRLHLLRWNRPAFSGKRLAFHIELARRLSAAGELVLSRLRVGNQVVSVLYDIRKGTRQYNIKMAFDPSFSSHLSLGLIHLGYAMEAAAGLGVENYDFLAGPGQKNDYKRHLGQAHRKLSSIQMLRGPLLPPLYRWYDAER